MRYYGWQFSLAIWEAAQSNWQRSERDRRASCTSKKREEKKHQPLAHQCTRLIMRDGPYRRRWRRWTGPSNTLALVELKLADLLIPVCL